MLSKPHNHSTPIPPTSSAHQYRLDERAAVLDCEPPTDEVYADNYQFLFLKNDTILVTLLKILDAYSLYFYIRDPNNRLRFVFDNNIDLNAKTLNTVFANYQYDLVCEIPGIGFLLNTYSYLVLFNYEGKPIDRMTLDELNPNLRNNDIVISMAITPFKKVENTHIIRITLQNRHGIQSYEYQCKNDSLQNFLKIFFENCVNLFNSHDLDSRLNALSIKRIFTLPPITNIQSAMVIRHTTLKQDSTDAVIHEIILTQTPSTALHHPESQLPIQRMCKVDDDTIAVLRADKDKNNMLLEWVSLTSLQSNAVAGVIEYKQYNDAVKQRFNITLPPDIQQTLFNNIATGKNLYKHKNGIAFQLTTDVKNEATHQLHKEFMMIYIDRQQNYRVERYPLNPPVRCGGVDYFQYFPSGKTIYLSGGNLLMFDPVYNDDLIDKKIHFKLNPHISPKPLQSLIVDYVGGNVDRTCISALIKKSMFPPSSIGKKKDEKPPLEAKPPSTKKLKTK